MALRAFLELEETLLELEETLLELEETLLELEETRPVARVVQAQHVRGEQVAEWTEIGPHVV